MKKFHVFLGCMLVFVLVVCASGVDVQGETKSNLDVDVKNPEKVEVGNVEKEKQDEVVKKLSPVVKDADTVIKGKDGVGNGSDASKIGSKKGTGDTDRKSSDGKTQGEQSEQKEKKKVVEDPKEGSKTGAGGVSKGSETEVKKEKPLGEECDMVNRCTDEGKTLVACLRVPGSDAPGLSLLIQNKGKGTMVVKISVPSFVELDKTSVELKENENQKVKVSFKKGGKDGDILLKTGTSHCSLHLKNLIANNNDDEVSALPKSKYFIILTETKSLSFMFIGLIVIIASVGLWLSLRRRRRQSTVSNYQKLDMELPITIGGEENKERMHSSEVNDGWDNGWDDNWDDEEAPMSPMPVTPSLSSKVLASRKLNKD